MDLIRFDTLEGYLVFGAAHGRLSTINRAIQAALANAYDTMNETNYECDHQLYKGADSYFMSIFRCSLESCLCDWRDYVSPARFGLNKRIGHNVDNWFEYNGLFPDEVINGGT